MKGRTVTVVVTLSLLTGCASSTTWTSADTVMEVAFQAVNAADAVTTARIRNRQDLEERQALTRAVLGPNPDPGETAVYFATVALSHYLIARALKPRWRRWFQAGTLTYSYGMVHNNCELGLC